jgi:hypothetical protein
VAGRANQASVIYCPTPKLLQLGSAARNLQGFRRSQVLLKSQCVIACLIG